MSSDGPHRSPFSIETPPLTIVEIDASKHFDGYISAVCSVGCPVDSAESSSANLDEVGVSIDADHLLRVHVRDPRSFRLTVARSLFPIRARSGQVDAAEADVGSGGVGRECDPRGGPVAATVGVVAQV